MDILTLEDDGRARKGNDSNQQGGGLCNMISIEELPEGYDEDLVVRAEPIPGLL